MKLSHLISMLEDLLADGWAVTNLDFQRPTVKVMSTQYGSCNVARKRLEGREVSIVIGLELPGKDDE